jgi:signal transduction histidine kinase
LGLALRSFIEGFIERSGIEVDLEISPELDRLPPETELVLFRIVQEALSNVARHSRSATARIRLGRESTASGQSAVLIIEDAGKGMPEGERVHRLIGRTASLGPPGVGLASMRERLSQIGGRLEIDSVPGQTILTAVIPLRDERR